MIGRMKTIPISAQVVMYISKQKIFIRCPFVHEDGCLALEALKATPIPLQFKPFANGLEIKHRYFFSDRTKDLIVQNAKRYCKQCSDGRKQIRQNINSQTKEKTR